MCREITQTNGLKDKKIEDYTQGFSFERWRRLFVSRKEGRRELTSIEDYVDADASIQELEKYIKNSK